VSPLDVLVPLIALAAGAALTLAVLRRGRDGARKEPPASTAKILFPFVGTELSERALEAAIRLARAEQATVVPAYLASVPLPLALDAPLARTCDEAFSVFEAIEQRATRAGVPVDARIARGRNVRHAMRQLIAEVPARRIVVAAADGARHDGFSVDDVAWLLRNAPREVVVLRPDPERRPLSPPDRRSTPRSRTRRAGSSRSRAPARLPS
jgi:nucleotide-binding universal stress UspA family protein